MFKKIQKKLYKKTYKNKRLVRTKRLFRNHKYFISKKTKLFTIKEKIDFIINIKITPNNIFCCLTNNKTIKKTLILISAGILKLKVSKKKLKFASKYIVQKFIKNIRFFVQKKTLNINITGPIKIRKRILKQLLSNLKKNKFLINIQEKKSFNGCRPKKIRRKKRKGFRILK